MATTRRVLKEDKRKGYPMGTRGSVAIEANTDEPQTKARGKEFARIIGDTMTEACALVELRLRKAGFTDLNVWIDMGNTSIGYWFDGSIAVDVYEMRRAQAEEE